MGNKYHAFPQADRIQKRLVLNRCFKQVLQQGTPWPGSLIYITLGGGDVRDLLDLVCVFDVTKFEVRAFSFESEMDIARAAASSAVVTTLSKIPTVDVSIVHGAISSAADRLREIRPQNRFIYFLDYTRVFTRSRSEDLETLLSARLLRSGDFLLITSNLTPRYLRQEAFMRRDMDVLHEIFGAKANGMDFRERNHVDYYVAQIFSRAYAGFIARRLTRIRYNDTGTPMGVWVFEIKNGNGTFDWVDDLFEEYPSSFIRPARDDENELDLFDDL